MTDQVKSSNRDEVLFAFHQECERPSAEQIVAWVKRFPQFADDIRAHAAVAWDWATQVKASPEEIDETMAARAYSQALNIIFNAQIEPAPTKEVAPARTFSEIQTAANKETHQLAREMDVGRDVLADLFNGWMQPPLRKRLVDGLLSALHISSEEFSSALECALSQPRLGHAKANQAPVVVPRTCDDIIRDSNMLPERKRYWLEEN